MTFKQMMQDVLEDFGERAAIFEFDGEETRQDAERKAMEYIEEKYGAEWMKILDERFKVRAATWNG